MTKVAMLVLLVGCGRVGFDARSDGAGASIGDGDRDGDVPMATSCNGLANTCGPTGTDSCCDSPVVTGGTYARSYDVSGDGMYPDDSFGATVSTFRLDKYKVTVGRFRQFVAAGMGTQANPPVVGAGAHPTIAGSGWDASWNGSLEAGTAALVADAKCDVTYETWTDAAGPNESLPMTCITWFEAMAFCAWDGGFLPTEAEWNYAASGGNEQRAYPWSSPPGSLAIDCSNTNYYDGTSYCVNPPTGAANRVGSESPTGDGKWGQSDLVGDVWEWMLDWNAPPYAQNPCPDCANLTPGTDRVFRGADFFSAAPLLRTGYRTHETPSYLSDYIGIRCARTP